MDRLKHFIGEEEKIRSAPLSPLSEMDKCFHIKPAIISNNNGEFIAI